MASDFNRKYIGLPAMSDILLSHIFVDVQFTSMCLVDIVFKGYVSFGDVNSLSRPHDPDANWILIAISAGKTKWHYNCSDVKTNNYLA